MTAPMSDRTNHRRVLHFAVTGVLLGGAAGCTSNEQPKTEVEAKVKGEPKTLEPREPEPEMKFAPNPGPNERDGLEHPEVAPTTAVKPEPEPVPEPEDIVNEGPVKEPVPVGINEGPQKEPVPKPKPEPKRVNTGPIEETKPPIKVNPGPEG